jgi:plasmid stabilization system protein ParE
MSGRAGTVAGTRELVIPDTPMIAAYAIDGERAVILAIYHGAQKWPDIFKEIGGWWNFPDYFAGSGVPPS